MRLFPGIFLLINGLVYCGLALLFVTAPLEWFARLGIELQDTLGYTELKTMYIGLMGSMGVYSLLAVSIRHIRQAALLLFLLSYVFLAAVRSWGIWVDGQFDDFTTQLLLTEIVSAVAAGFALLTSRQQQSCLADG